MRADCPSSVTCDFSLSNSCRRRISSACFCLLHSCSAAASASSSSCCAFAVSCCTFSWCSSCALDSSSDSASRFCSCCATVRMSSLLSFCACGYFPFRMSRGSFRTTASGQFAHRVQQPVEVSPHAYMLGCQCCEIGCCFLQFGPKDVIACICIIFAAAARRRPRPNAILRQCICLSPE